MRFIVAPALHPSPLGASDCLAAEAGLAQAIAVCLAPCGVKVQIDRLDRMRSDGSLVWAGRIAWNIAGETAASNVGPALVIRTTANQTH